MEIILNHAEGLVAGPGLYRMPAKAYHADPAPEPSLSSSIAKLLIAASPEHAFIAHPRLAKLIVADPAPPRPKEIGSAAHKIVLGQGADVEIIDEDDYKTGAAKAARTRAYAVGAAPILRPDHEMAEAIAAQVAERLARVPGCEGFGSAPAEIAAIVRDGSGAWLRILMDRFEDNGTHAIIWDLKTGDQSAAPFGLGRRMENMGMEVQGALYCRVIETLIPRLAGRVRFRWIFVENEFPHALSVAEVDAAGMETGARKVDAALHLWNRCRARGEWPGYPARIVQVEFPSWAADRWADREAVDPDLKGVVYGGIENSPWRPFEERAA